jgi:two-component system, NtrC family, nitrogen regulation sensor histidine kinase NtrY
VKLAPGWLRTDRAILFLALASGLPGTVAAVFLLWNDADVILRWTLLFLLLIWWIGFALAARSRFVRPVQTLANLLAALRMGDFSVRGRAAHPDDPLGLAMIEVNALSDRLKAERLGGVEAGALLRAVLAEVEVAIIAFDADDRIQFLNRAAGTLLGTSADAAMGRSAGDLRVLDLLDTPAPATIERTFPGSAGRWDLRRGTFRQDGLPHRLVVLSDVSRALREEEREAWKRLVRVLSHEINNSLAPIHSIAGSLLDLVRHEPADEAATDDLRQGLAVISSRAGALSRFMGSYARLARLPAPRPGEIELQEWVPGIARLEVGGRVEVVGGPPVRICGDPDQLEQVLINLLRNAIEATEDGTPVEVGWTVTPNTFEIWVRDRGPGVASTQNLFVPFFTTKPGGTGIGLVLSRQIAEAHGGRLTLESRDDGAGTVARLRLPR